VAFRQWVALLAAGALLQGCGSQQAPADTAAAPAIATLEVGAAGLASARGWDGVVEAVQQAQLSAQTAGRVAAVLVDVNDRVAAGAVLLRLTAFEQQAGVDTAQAQLKSAEAQLAEAESRYRRAAELIARQLISRADHDLAVAGRDTAIAARDAARAQLQQAQQQSAYTVVRAPYAGIVSTRQVEPGEVVAPGQPLLGLYAPGALRVEVQVPQTQAVAIRAAGNAKLVLADGRELAAKSITVFPSADPLTHAVGVRVLLPALSPAPQPGTTAKVIFPVAGGATTLRVPASAVAQRGEVSAVYVLSGTKLSLRQLRLGERQGDAVAVIAGLAPGEHIAVDPVAAAQWLVAQRTAAGAKHE
jgi:RND family efflux transporter MFP subunit